MKDECENDGYDAMVHASHVHCYVDTIIATRSHA